MSCKCEKIILLLLAILMGWLPLPAQEALRYPVVKIISTNDFGEEETGAGFVVGSMDGALYLFTAAHVIGDPNAIKVEFYKGPTVPATLVQANTAVDIAVISCPVPERVAIEASFSVAKGTKRDLQSVIAIGHPYSNYWDINLRPHIKSTEYDFDPRLFTLTPDGIAAGSSGGPVLDLQYELLGLVTAVDQVKAVCVDANTLLKAMQAWEIPSNLLVGITVAKEAPAGDDDYRYRLFVQEANSAFAAGKWVQARRAYEQANAIRASEEFAAKIRQCEVEIAKDEAYERFMAQGKAAIALETALSFYQQAQQQRNTEEVRRVIQQIKEKITQPGIPAPLSNDLPPRYTDPSAGTMVLVEGGTFAMGCDTCDQEVQWPAHQVYVDHFYMGAYEVTIDQFCRFLNERAGEMEQPLPVEGISAVRKGKKYVYSPNSGKEKMPVFGVNYCQIQAYCWWLGAKTGHVYRLPTEAEWEYAARGGKHSKGFRYAGSNDPDAVAWFRSFTNGIHLVGLKKPNELGLYDMSGNAWEWCQDWFAADYYESCQKEGTIFNPRGPVIGERRVKRGGSHFEFPLTYRAYEHYEIGEIGFRLVREPHAVYAGREIGIDFIEQNMVLLEGGAFSMGSTAGKADNAPVHQVRLDDFYLSKLEITRPQWTIVMGDHLGLDNCPTEYYSGEIVTIQWQEVDTFIQRLNAMTGMNYRLPTEAEWEYAARGGKNGGNSQANELNLYGMSGSVPEWCYDWYGENYYAGSPDHNPMGPPLGRKKVVRGGDKVYLRHAEEPYSPWNSSKIGFRLARSLQGMLPQPEFHDPFEMEMVFIKGGTAEVEYEEYSDTEKYTAELGDFYMAPYEVTQAQWEYVMGVNPDKETPCPQCPVLNFYTEDIKKFIETLNAASGKKYRLPFEAEWVWAASGGGTMEKDHWAGTDNELELYRYANYCDANCNQRYEAKGALAKNDGHQGVAPVGSYLPNALRLYDMTGNAAELCHPPDADPKKDYSSLIVKGGSYKGYSFDIQLSKRIDGRMYESSTGFRLVRIP